LLNQSFLSPAQHSLFSFGSAQHFFGDSVAFPLHPVAASPPSPQRHGSHLQSTHLHAAVLHFSPAASAAPHLHGSQVHGSHLQLAEHADFFVGDFVGDAALMSAMMVDFIDESDACERTTNRLANKIGTATLQIE